MTIQKKIREGIAKAEFELVLRLACEHEFTLSAYTWEELEPKLKEYYYYRAEQILKNLHSQGVVIHKDQTFPSIQVRGVAIQPEELERLLLGCGFFEPLIKALK